MAALVFAASPLSPAAELGLAGSEEIVWVHRTGAESVDGIRLLHFAFMSLEERGGRFLPLHQDETGGEAGRTAVSGAHLHVFFEDGTHLRYVAVARGNASRQGTFWELKLPNSCVPAAVAGDSTGGTLYAVVPGRIAEFLQHEPAAQTRGDTAEVAIQPAVNADLGLQTEPLADDSAEPASKTTARPVAAAYCLVRHTRGTWWRDREIPAFFDDQAGCLLAVSGGMCDLYFTRSGESAVTYFARVEDGDWSELEQVTAAPWDRLLACGIADGEAIVVVSQGDRLAVLSRQDDRWTERAGIDNPTDGGWATPARMPVACAAGAAVAVAWLDAEDGVRAGVWHLSGDVAAAPVVVEALAARPPAMVSKRTLEVVPYAVLTLALLYIFTRRRHSVVLAANLRPDQTPASYGRRMSAFLLDAVIASPATASVMSGWLVHVETEGDFETALALHPSEFFWRWLVALAIYIAYCTLFEALFGATPGKMITGCRVVADDGTRCSFGAIVVRNLLRCVEFFPPRFAFAPLLILVFLTRNRQRLGDLVARSVVVEAAEGGVQEQRDKGT